ncbi:MAG: ComEC/Rec2 family competence protein [Actinomycetota bacterium]|nr:ComEC/Rec2 family competence protein [Actinomycetota bacterium]
MKEQNVRESYDIEVIGRISSHPYCKMNNYYFEIRNASIIFTDRFSKNTHHIENINDIFTSYSLQENEEFSLIRDDTIKMNIEDLKKYTDEKGEQVSVFFTSKVEKINSSSFFLSLYKIRQKIFSFLLKIFRGCFSYKNYSFASAVLLGNQKELSQSLKESFMKSGLYHMLSISGLHLSILFSIIPLFLSRVSLLFSKKSKNAVEIFCFLLLLFFNMLVGLKAAMMRASIFFIVYSLSRSSRSFNLPINIFFMALIVMLLIFPDFLSSAGFILSFCATAGIIIISPVIRKLFFLLPGGKNIVGNYFTKILIINAAVNIFILPLSFYYFGGYYALSFLTNMICSPIFYLALILLFAGAVSALFLPFPGNIFLKSASYLIKMLIDLSYFFSGSSFGYMETKFFNKGLNVFLYYLLIAFIILMINYFLSFRYKMKVKNVV